ncbi:hypothetical protein F4810DRAFT_692370 [Camillea tinctor]|nr:hypothetical protein F4810DRAFT_692370 [Camillea tinctor]
MSVQHGRGSRLPSLSRVVVVLVVLICTTKGKLCMMRSGFCPPFYNRHLDSLFFFSLLLIAFGYYPHFYACTPRSFLLSTDWLEKLSSS